MPKVPLLALEEMWVTLLEPEYLFTLGQDILPPYLLNQRWFRGKARELASCRAVDWCKLGASFYMFMIEAGYSSGDGEFYVMPLKIVQGEAAESLSRQIPDSIVATVKNWRGEGILYDALMDVASCDVLFGALADGRRYRTSEGGTLSLSPTSVFEELTGPESPCFTVRKLGAEQSNTSIIIGDTFVLKLYRKLEVGVNPDVEMNLYLTEKSRFSGIARVAGVIRYLDRDGHESTVGMLQEYARNQGDGWSFTLKALREFDRNIESGMAEGQEPPLIDTMPGAASGMEPPAEFLTLAGEYLQAVGTLGRRTAEFHLALAKRTDNADFRPMKTTRSFARQLSEGVCHEIGEALALLSGRIAELPAKVRKDADLVLREGPALMGLVESLAGLEEDLGSLIRIHGDYHLGQVLRTEDDDFILLDFEGEPLRPLNERRRKSSPLKDVAGMIRSLHYAAHAPSEGEGEVGRRLAPWRKAWHAWAGAAFLRGYLEAAAGSPILPADNFDLLLETFLLEKVFYELRYELGNRPDWVHIPLAGIVEIINRQKTGRRNQ